MPTAVTIEHLALHVADIAVRKGIAVRSHSRGGRSSRRQRWIAIRPVLSTLTYAVAMHELGHVLGRQVGTRLDREIGAWEWARAHSLVWDERMSRERDKSLESYVRWAQRRQRADKRGRVFITDDHPVWRYVEP